MAFIAEDVATLYKRTGYGIMNYKRTLTESNGGMDAIVDVLRERGLAAANRGSGRTAMEDITYAQVNALNSVAMVVEINTEADFVTEDTEFQAFVRTVVGTMGEQDPTGADALPNLIASDFDKKTDDLFKKKIQTIDKSTKIHRFAHMEGPITSCVHTNGRVSVIAQLGTSAEIATKSKFQEYTKNATTQIVAVNLSCLNEQAVPADVVEHEKRILTEQVISDGKPVTIAKKIVVDYLSKFFRDTCLADRVYVKNSDKSVQQYTDSIAKKLSGEITIEASAHFEKGGDLEKREDSLADGVVSVVR